MRIVLKKSDWMDDWYTIVRAEHDGREWFEADPKYPNCSTLMLSERISDACVEGSASEMLEIAQGIKDRAEVHFKRCAVQCNGARVQFWSPRNSRKRAVVSYVEAHELAEQIERELGGA